MNYRYCNNCGTANPATNAFCQECGSKMNEVVTPAPAPTPAAQQVPPKKKKSKLIIIIPVILCAILLGVGSAFAYFRFIDKTEIDIVKDFDDTVLEITGYDGEGEIKEIKRDVIRQKLAYYDADGEVQRFIDSIQYTTDKDEDRFLSNGAKVTIVASYDQGYAEDHNIVVKNANNGMVEKTIKLDGFQEKKEDSSTEYSYDYDTPDYYVGDTESYYDERETLDDGAYFRVSEEDLTEEDVSTWSRDEVQLWINYLYAKNGYSFKKETDTKDYFESMDWYLERDYTDATQAEVEANLTKTEKANLKILTKRRKELDKK